MGCAGIGYGQLISSGIVVTYYCSIMALTVFYLAASFSAELPWATCPAPAPYPLPDARPYAGRYECFDARGRALGPAGANATLPRRSSSELYFK